MSRRRLLALKSAAPSGCLYHATERTDEAVCALTAHPFDPAPPEATEAPPRPPVLSGAAAPSSPTDVRTAALMGADRPQPPVEPRIERTPVKVPPEIPGAETPPVENFNKLPPEQKLAAIRKLYPPLPPLKEEPAALPGPDGRPYTLADLQQTAAGNSPTLRQAASDVEAARGALEQAWAYPNPNVSYQASPSSDGTTPAQGFVIDQSIKTGGKQTSSTPTTRTTSPPWSTTARTSCRTRCAPSAASTNGAASTSTPSR